MTHYDILGVSQTASQDEIKQAYRDMAKAFHPDLYSGREEFARIKTAQLIEAYSVLRDPKRRAEYDTWISSNANNSAASATAEHVKQEAPAEPPDSESPPDWQSSYNPSDLRKSRVKPTAAFAVITLLVFVLVGSFEISFDFLTRWRNQRIAAQYSTATPETTSLSNLPTNITLLDEECVYWVPDGKSYHSTRDCPTLSRSRHINGGSLEYAISIGKDDPCSRCVGD